MESAQHDYQNKLRSASFYKNKPEQSKQIMPILIRTDSPYFLDNKIHLLRRHVNIKNFPSFSGRKTKVATNLIVFTYI